MSGYRGLGKVQKANRPFYQFRNEMSGWSPIAAPDFDPAAWPVPPGLQPEPPLTDQFGLATAVFGRAPDAVRQYVVMALKDLKLPLDRSPSPIITIPEACMYGLLMSAGLRRGVQIAARTFVFQSFELGGRVPGGAVVDFAHAYNHTPTAIRVQSIYHSPASAFLGLGATFRERDQEIRLLGQAGFALVVDVNRPEEGLPLERGTSQQVRREQRRALGLQP